MNFSYWGAMPVGMTSGSDFPLQQIDRTGAFRPHKCGYPLSFNSRTAGLQEAYRRGTGAGYRERLLAAADQFGLTPETIANKAAPMLVRLYDDAVGDLDASLHRGFNLDFELFVDDVLRDAASANYLGSR